LDNNPVSANSIGKYFKVNGSSLARQYKNHLSGYEQWEQLLHAEDWILFEDNLGSFVCIDEVSLSDGELYTVVTNGGAKCQKGSLIAMIKGVRSSDVCSILEKIPLSKRYFVKEVTLDLANNMEKIARVTFPKATIISDRYHVQKLPTEALQEMRIKLRWEAIDEENENIVNAKKEGNNYSPKVYVNGDTKKQLLARSRYLLFKTPNKWSNKQKQRATILFKLYPELHNAYKLTMMFRGIYEHSKSVEEAKNRLAEWYDKVNACGFKSFITAANSIMIHQETILAYFIKRRTNALAENFNGKIKAFRAVFRGVRDVSFFLYRISLIFA
jgi:transposase